jgi:nitrogen regulatory protein PII
LPSLEQLEVTKSALMACGISGITVSSVNGFGKQRGHREFDRGVGRQARLLAKVMAVIRESAMTGESGVASLA